MKKRFVLLLALCFSALPLCAKVQETARFNFGKVGSVTFTAAPQTIESLTGSAAVEAEGSPLYFVDAPGRKRLAGEGSILFNGKTDCYLNKDFTVPAGENLLFEVWVKPRVIDHGDQHQSEVRAIATVGNGAFGYIFAQRGKNLMLYSGGKGNAMVAPVVPGVWVHLAVTQHGDKCVYWLNGERKGEMAATEKVDPGIYIGSRGNGNSSFNGEIYEVRLATFKGKNFDPLADFSIDYQENKEKSAARTAANAAFIEKLERPAAGKEVVAQLNEKLQTDDWLIKSVDNPCKLLVEKSKDGQAAMFRMDNGLVNRTFLFSDNAACVSYRNLSDGAEYLRGIKPEARIMIDSVWYEVGGLKGQPEYAYLVDSWYKELQASPRAFAITDIEVGSVLERYQWRPKYNSIVTPWPAEGLRVSMVYEPTDQIGEMGGLTVKVHYEIYEGLPVMTKWVEVLNASETPKMINKIECEILALAEDRFRRIHATIDYSFAMVRGNPITDNIVDTWTMKDVPYSGSPVLMEYDPEYNTWVGPGERDLMLYGGVPVVCLLKTTVPMGPQVEVTRDEPFHSFLTIEQLFDSDDLERKTLGVRRMFRKLAPQTTESLICGGMTSNDPDELKGFIDQMAELKMERLDVMAWPGIQYDNLDPDYVALWKDVASYARDRGIIVGGYELQVASRGRGAEYDCIDPNTGKPGCYFGQSVCLASKWQDVFFSNMYEFLDKTGLMSCNIDGPYHGDVCASAEHPHHKGLEDSQWRQWQAQVAETKEMQRRGMFVNMPDDYTWSGCSVMPMGYREAVGNLTPTQQMLLGRQYVYDGTWTKLSTMGWMTLQLVGFYSNDPRIGLEPLCENLEKYENQLVQYLASGCQMTIRGRRIYDTPETKTMVKKWIDWFLKYRSILTSDVLHIGRPTGRDLDCIVHVNPELKEKAIVVVFNPTESDVTKEILLPLYYTGLKDNASVREQEGPGRNYKLDDQGRAFVEVTVPAGRFNWYVVE